MKSNTTSNNSIARSLMLSIMLGLFLVMGIQAPAVQAESTMYMDSTAMQHLDEFLQKYLSTEYCTDPYASSYTDAQLNEMKTALETYAKDKTSNEFASLSQLQKLEYTTRYVAERIYYDKVNKGSDISYKPYDVWKNQTAVCYGYSNLLTTLLLSEDIPSVQIMTNDHAYNICYDADNQKWIYIDATWCSKNTYDYNDDKKPIMQKEKYLPLFFNMSLDVLMDRTSHYPYSIGGIVKDGIKYRLYMDRTSDTNTQFNPDTFKNVDDWNLRIVGLTDKSLTKLNPSKIDEFPIIRMYGGFNGSNLEEVDLSQTEIDSIISPDNVTGTFQDCTKLKKVVLPDTVKRIENSAFMNCTALESINMPKSLSQLCNDIFKGCTSLTDVDFSKTAISIIGLNAFENCTALKSVDFGAAKSLSLASYAFMNCTALESVDCSKANITKLNNNLPGKNIPGSAFYKCSSLKELDFSNSTFTTTGQSTFAGCSKLTSIIFPATLENIEYSALSNTALTRLDLSNTALTTIGYQACMSVRTLKEIDLPSTVTSIDQNAFALSGSTTISTTIISPFTKSEIEKMSSSGAWANRLLKCYTGSYQLVYDGNGADAGTMTNQTCRIGADAKTTLYTNRYTKEGYTFTGWNTKADGSGTSYEDKSTIDPLTSENDATVTLYAMWKQNATQPDKPETPDKPSNPDNPDTPDKPSNPEEDLEEYAITYKLDNGTNHKDNPEYYTSGEEVELKDPTKEGHTFHGWFLDKDYTNQITKIEKDLTGQITLYALWDACQWEETSKRAATCTSKGSVTYTCTKCKATKREPLPIDPTNHGATGIINKKTATTTKEGYTGDTYCYRCTKIITTGTVIPKKSSGSSNTTTTPGTSQQPSTSAKPGNSTSGKSTTATTPNDVEDLKVVNKKGKAMKITWTKQTGIKGYELQYAMDKKFKKSPKTIALKANAASKTIKKLKKKTYFVRIRCYTQTGTEKTYSAWSTVKKVKITK